MARDEASFRLTLEGNVSSAADAAASSLERLAAQIQSDTAALGAMRKALRNVKGATDVSAESVEKLKAQIDIQRAVIGNAQARMLELGGAEAVVAASQRRVAVSAGASAEAVRNSATAAREAEQAQRATIEAMLAQERANGKASASDRLRAASLQEAQRALTDTSREVNKLKAALANVGEDSDFAGKLRAQLARARGALQAAQERVIALGDETQPVAGRFARLRQAFTRAGSAAGALPGPLGKAGKGLAGVGAGGTAAAAAVTAVVLASLAAAAALSVLTVKLGRYGVALAGALRDERVHLQALRAMSPLYYQAGASADSMQRSIDKVSASSALGREKIVEYHEQLYRAGLRGANLERALQGVSVTAAATGEQGAQWFIRQARYARMYGGEIDKLSARYEERFGAVAAAKALALPVQVNKLRESFAGLFGGLKIDGLLRGVQRVFSWFRETESIGRAIKATFETLFQPMVNGAANSVPIVKRFLQGVTIAALRVTLGFLRTKNAIRDAFAGTALASAAKNFDKLEAAVFAGKVAVGALVLAFGALALVAGTVAAAVVVAVGSVVAPFALVGFVVYGAIEAFRDLKKWFSEQDWGKLARSLIDGLVGGIKAGVSRVTGAIKSLAGSAVSAFRSVLGIHSPSRVTRQFGAFTADGYVAGLEARDSAVKRAVADVFTFPGAESPVAGAFDPAAPAGDAPAQAVNPAGAPRGAVTVNVTIPSITVHSAAGDAPEIAKDLEKELAKALRNVATEIGAAA